MLLISSNSSSFSTLFSFLPLALLELGLAERDLVELLLLLETLLLQLLPLLLLLDMLVLDEPELDVDDELLFLRRFLRCCLHLDVAASSLLWLG